MVKQESSNRKFNDVVLSESSHQRSLLGLGRLGVDQLVQHGVLLEPREQRLDPDRVVDLDEHVQDRVAVRSVILFQQRRHRGLRQQVAQHDLDLLVGQFEAVIGVEDDV